MDKQTKKEFQNLSRIVQKGFRKTDKRFSEVGVKFNAINKRFNGVEAEIIGVKVGVNEMKADVRQIKQRTNETWTLLDGYVKSQEDFKQEFEIMKYKIDRIEKVIKEKLGVEIH